MNFYRRFIPDCAAIVQPLNNILVGTPKEDAAITLSAVRAFDTIKKKRAMTTLLDHPQQDGPTSVAVDASNTTVGALLQQRINNQ